ncbi:hypothetical protein KP509_23G009400 [Ceratopteris richardii]|uniref:Uncharacterized protein n=1 Tax=Ceratopteris richardii TaxID=49495 RepID=A0A8T2RXF8_CERRI|nr:hypothetical protein KP509_23G009400 [Ceratopteris richardii]
MADLGFCRSQLMKEIVARRKIWGKVNGNSIVGGKVRQCKRSSKMEIHFFVTTCWCRHSG